MTEKFKLDDYVTVAERIAAFHTRHPEGSLQAEVVTMTDKLVVVKAYAYRTADDIRPGIGWSSLEIPGKTPYTRGSELENAESSAWGRAIAALGFEVKRGIATANEIANKDGGERMKAPTSAEIASERKRTAAPLPDEINEADYVRILEIGRTAKENDRPRYDEFQVWLEREFGGWQNFINTGGRRVDEAIAVFKGTP